MQILFADESGTAPKMPGKLKYFVVAGVIIPEDQWSGCASELMGLKKRLKIYGEIKWKYFSPSNKNTQNSILHLAEAQRDWLRRAIYQILTSRKSIKVICSVASIHAAFSKSYVNNDDDLYFATYKPLTERFQYHLQDLTRTIGRKENGMVICDHRDRKQDVRLRELHLQMIQSSDPFTSNYKNLIEGLFLSSSEETVGIQLADMVAGAVARHFELGDSRCYQLVEPALRRSPSGQIDGYGIVKVPKREWR